MKKILFLLIFLPQISFAHSQNKFYIGADAIDSDVRYKYHIREVPDAFAPYMSQYSGESRRSNKISFALSGGYRTNFDKFFLAPELFYDYLNSTVKDPFATVYPTTQSTDKVGINYRYGVKLNLGYNIFSKVDIFATLGLARVNYDQKFRQYGMDRSGNIITPTYGFGLLYNIGGGLAAKLGYERQKLETPYMYTNEDANSRQVNKVTIQVYRAGLVYSF